MHLNFRSLQVRLCAWYILFTFASFACCGFVLTVYLKYALRASRYETMQRRQGRLAAFMDAESKEVPGFTFNSAIRRFALSNPESDFIEVEELDGRRIFPDSARAQMPIPTTGCITPCLTDFQFEGHKMRGLTQVTVLAGRRVRLTVAGTVDEHYDILTKVRSGYFLSLPLLLLGSIAGGYALSRRALSPVGRITTAVRALSLGNLKSRLPVPKTGDELQQLAEEWNGLLLRLDSALNRVTQFSHDASHDLRTSITVMQASAQLSLRKPRTDEQYRTTLSTIATECDHTLAVLEDMLFAAREDTSSQAIKCVDLDLSSLAAEACTVARARAELKQQSLHETLEADAYIEGNPVLLHRLLSILLDNAIKYTQRSGEVKVRTWRDVANGIVVLSIQDDGIGISPEAMPRIFDRFFRADAARRNGLSVGSGLGLSIAKWIVEVHGGSIHASSEPHCGSSFLVSLPASEEYGSNHT